jgi:hypothetical protein
VLGLQSPKAQVPYYINYEQKSKDLSLGIDIIYAADDRVGGADGK